MTQSRFAEVMNENGWIDFTQAVVSRLENGARPVTLAESFAIARALNTTPERMMHPITVDEVNVLASKRELELRKAKEALAKEILYFSQTRDSFFYTDGDLSATDNEKFVEILYRAHKNTYVNSSFWQVCLEAFEYEYTELRNEYFDGGWEDAPKHISFPSLEEWVANGLGIIPKPGFIDESFQEIQEKFRDAE